jgi:hypothetical protein
MPDSFSQVSLSRRQRTEPEAQRQNKKVYVNGTGGRREDGHAVAASAHRPERMKDEAASHERRRRSAKRRKTDKKQKTDGTDKRRRSRKSQVKHNIRSIICIACSIRVAKCMESESLILLLVTIS